MRVCIRNVKMPSRCYACGLLLSCGEGEYICALSGKLFTRQEVVAAKERDEDCWLEEVPENIKPVSPSTNLEE